MKLLIRYDVPGWAWHRRAVALAQYAPELVMGHYRRPERQPIDITLKSDAQYTPNDQHDREYHVVFLSSMTSQWTRRPDQRLVQFVGSHAWLYEDYCEKDWRTKGVNNNRCRELASEVLPNCDLVGVHCTEQQRGLQAFNDCTVLMPYCVDLSRFQPPEDKAPSDRLRVGWCGQLGGGLNNFKGFVEVMIPLISRFGERFDWRINPSDHNARMSTWKLVAWYGDLDVFLTTSVAEGGPQPPFEAAACGCAVISTDVGQVSDWRVLRDLGHVVPTYRNAGEAAATVDAVGALLCSLDKDRGRLARGRAACLESVRQSYDAASEYPKQMQAIVGDRYVCDTR